jgi:hypothetical protein
MEGLFSRESKGKRTELSYFEMLVEASMTTNSISKNHNGTVGLLCDKENSDHTSKFKTLKNVIMRDMEYCRLNYVSPLKTKTRRRVAGDQPAPKRKKGALFDRVAEATKVWLSSKKPKSRDMPRFTFFVNTRYDTDILKRLTTQGSDLRPLEYLEDYLPPDSYRKGMILSSTPSNYPRLIKRFRDDGTITDEDYKDIIRRFKKKYKPLR